MRMPDMRCLLVAAVTMITVFAAPVLGDATAWNYTTDFSTTTNPSGAWSYGWLNSSSSLFAISTFPVVTSFNGTDYAFWADEPAGNPSPGVILGTVPMDYEPGPGYGGAYLPPGGYLNSPANTAKPDVRWVSPVAAQVHVTATFKGTTYSGTGSNTNVLVLKNGNAASPLFSATIQGFPGGGSHLAVGTNHTAIYTADLAVNSGDVIDFAASCPSARTIRDNVTLEVSITIGDMPDPETLTGTVTDQATGAPIGGATVNVVGTSVGAVTNEQGAYTLQIAPGTYSLDVSATYYQALTVAGVVVATGGGVHNVSLVKVTEWSLAGDWSSAQNPNSSWTYGRYLTAFYTHALPLDYYGVSMWRCADDQFSLTAGSFVSDADLDGIFYPFGTVAFIPGVGSEGSGARWTAPYAATVRVNAIWSGRYHAGPVAAEFRILKNGCTTAAQTLLHDTIDGYAGGGGSAATGTKPISVWTGLVTVAKGDTIDFVAGIPTGGSRAGSTVGLDARIATAGSEIGVTRLSDLTKLKSGQYVTITEPKVVTVGAGTLTDGTCYVEDVDRVMGLKVIVKSGLGSIAAGDRVMLEGILGADPNGERTVYVTNITSRQPGDPLGPLGASNKSIQTIAK